MCSFAWTLQANSTVTALIHSESQKSGGDFGSNKRKPPTWFVRLSARSLPCLGMKQFY